jgi:hypothetical protein
MDPKRSAISVPVRGWRHELLKPPIVAETTVQLGYPESVILGLGIVLLACTVLYVIPRSAVLGGILLTGYLGGAVATTCVSVPACLRFLFPVILGTLLWGGLFLRDERLRELIPLRTQLRSTTAS